MLFLFFSAVVAGLIILRSLDEFTINCAKTQRSHDQLQLLKMLEENLFYSLQHGCETDECKKQLRVAKIILIIFLGKTSTMECLDYSMVLSIVSYIQVLLPIWRVWHLGL